VDAPTALPFGALVSPEKACRALRVAGQVRDESGNSVVTGTLLDRPRWLVLGEGARLVLKHAETSREVVFAGPGRVLPCPRGEEQFLLTEGRATTAVWAGARPGAEVLIASPIGVVRYGDAELDVTAAPHVLAVKSRVGDAWLEGTDGSSRKVGAGAQGQRTAAAVDVKALLVTCEEASRASEARARDVLAPASAETKGTPLGARAAEHVRARRAARTACAIAGAALGTLEKGPERDALEATLAAAEERWRGVPSRVR
jgi:hypothetical protein